MFPIWHQYPYTDLHDLNLDMILSKMQELEGRLDGILDEAIRQATENAEAYVDSIIDDVLNDFNLLRNQVNQLSHDFDDLEDAMEVFETLINLKIEGIRNDTKSMVDAANARTDVLIQTNNEYLLSQMETYLSQIKVVNYFTGEKVTIQDMFNYLAMLHLNDSINYATMASRVKTYNQLSALNITYTDLVMHGNTLYV